MAAASRGLLAPRQCARTSPRAPRVRTKARTIRAHSAGREDLLFAGPVHTNAPIRSETGDAIRHRPATMMNWMKACRNEGGLL